MLIHNLLYYSAWVFNIEEYYIAIILFITGLLFPWQNDVSDILDLTFSMDADEEKHILYEKNEVCFFLNTIIDFVCSIFLIFLLASSVDPCGFPTRSPTMSLNLEEGIFGLQKKQSMSTWTLLLTIF